MNDTELDELLNIWKTPPVRGAWRESVQNRIARKHRKPIRELFRWRLLVAGTSMAVVILLMANTSAFSRKLSLPYTVDSEIRHYLAEQNVQDVPPGSHDRRTFFPPIQHLLVTSYNQAGSEVILSTSLPNNPLKSALAKIFLAAWDAADKVKRRFLIVSPDEDAAAFAFVYPSSPRSDMAMVVGKREELTRSGCQTSHGGAKLVGHEVILNYPVTGVQQLHRGGMEMITLWMAPELSCFALRATIHAKQPDGTWKLLTERQALKVTVNR